jgi:ribulose 1,5-bisphosphate carboxylase large subunit-like protein
MFDVFQPEIDVSKYIIVTYDLASTKSLQDAAWNLAIGQSVGNPNVRNAWENDELFQTHSCLILEKRSSKRLQHKSGIIKIAFPLSNIDIEDDGVSQLLCHLMGGQLDIDSIIKCHVLDVEFPTVNTPFLGPKFGIDGIRKFTKVEGKPLLGGIVKPKVCPNEGVLLDIVKQLVDNGINFIKEDEIMSNPACCTLEKRAPVITKYLDGKNVIYSFCINSDPHRIIDRAKFVHENGGNGVHVNFWSGMGSYNSIRKLNLPLFIHFQKSGDKIFTNKNHAFHIDFDVVCKLAGMMGVDTIHSGMWGGYSSINEHELRKNLKTLWSLNVVPALSCGMHPGLVDATVAKFGNNILLNVGGAIHGHPLGTAGGTRAMRDAIDGNKTSKEYMQAIDLWGYVK